MENYVFPNYLVDLYAVIWCFHLLHQAIREKMPLSVVSWCLAQIIIFGISFANGFLNKGYCVFQSCEPTNSLRSFFNINFTEDTIIFIRFIGITLMLLLITRMFRIINKKEVKKEKIKL